MKIRGKKGHSFKRTVKFPIVATDTSGKEYPMELKLESLPIGFERQ
jgi:hypothetical protein